MAATPVAPQQDLITAAEGVIAFCDRCPQHPPLQNCSQHRKLREAIAAAKRAPICAPCKLLNGRDTPAAYTVHPYDGHSTGLHMCAEHFGAHCVNIAKAYIDHHPHEKVRRAARDVLRAIQGG